MDVIIQNDEVLDVLQGQMATSAPQSVWRKGLEECTGYDIPLEGMTGMA